VPHDWDAETYDAIADPQFRWGTAVVDRLELHGDETVLDAGCGSGRVTALLAERLPDGRVIALDGSTSMLESARRRLAPFGDRIRFVLADLMAPLPIDEPVDAVLSTATFHWVPDHDALFANLAPVLRPGGRLVAQCGGFGNIARFLDVAATVDPAFVRNTHNFQTAEATAARLERECFVDIRTWLSDAPTPFASTGDLEAFIATVCLRVHLAQLPEERRAPFVREVAARLPERTLDYVRLNITARRAPA